MYHFSFECTRGGDTLCKVSHLGHEMNDSFKKHTLTDVLIDIQIRLHAAPHAISYHQFRFLIDLNFVAEN